MHTITFELQEKNVTLSLCDEGEVTTEREWVDNNDLLEKFFPTIEEMVESRGLSLQDISTFELKTENATGYTTVRIAETIVNTLNFAKKYD